jgi:hypothetical protein
MIRRGEFVPTVSPGLEHCVSDAEAAKRSALKAVE